MACISLVCSLWDPHGDTQHRVARRWSRILLAISGVPCRTFGLEKLNPAESYVLVSNHASYMDTPAIVSCIPLQFRFLAKDTLFSLPFLGWHLGRAGHVPVVRGDARASLKSLSTGARLLRERHVSLWVFPEGGRTPDRMRRFEEGAAYLAIKAGVPIVPIGLVGTRPPSPCIPGKSARARLRFTWATPSRPPVCRLTIAAGSTPCSSSAWLSLRGNPCRWPRRRKLVGKG